MKILPKSFDAVKTLDSISKYSIYLLVFLLPIFFLPFTANVLDFNKQALLLVLVFVSLFSYMIKSLIAGKIVYKTTIIHFVLAIFFLVVLISTALSLWKYGSFWGWPQSTGESLATLIGFLILFLLTTSIFAKKEIIKVLSFFSISGVIACFIGLLQLFSRFIFPFSFTKIVSFNTLGSINSMALFASFLVPIIIVFLMTAKKYWKILSLIGLVILLLLLVLVNFRTAWWSLIIGSALLMVLGVQKKDLFDSRWIILPMFLLAISLFFLFFNIRVVGFIQKPIEVSLTQKATLGIALKSLRDNPVFGSGPGTFVYDFSRYKNENFNQTQLWNVRFEGGSSKILTMLATTGVLGLLSFLALIAFFLLAGVKYFSKEIKKEDSSGLLVLGVFASMCSLIVGYFLYNSILSIDFSFFLLLALAVALTAEARKEITLKPSSLPTLGVTFAFTIIFIFGLGILILEGQRYVGEVSYAKGLAYWQKGEEVQGQLSLERAVSINPKPDLYFRDLSQIYLQRLSAELKRTDISKEDITKNAQLLVNNAINAARIATELNPKNPSNWSVRGFVYQNLIGVVPDVKDLALKMYDEAINLEPSNPYLYTQKGLSLVKEASLLTKDQEVQRTALYSDAQTQIEKAIGLKDDYAAARFQLAMLFQVQGKSEQAITGLENTRKYASQDVGLAFQLGLLYYQSKDYEKAQGELERAVSLDPKYSNALYFLGLVYDQLGQRQKAIEMFTAVLDLNPENEEVAKILSNLKAGKKALDGLVAEKPATAPIKEEK